MNDLQIKTHIAQSKANGKFQRMQEIKAQRAKLKEESDKLELELIRHIKEHGKVLAYKGDLPHILQVGIRTSTKFDKAQLADGLGVSQKELTTVRIAELVENGELTAQRIEELMFTEQNTVLKARKASAKDLSLILG